MTRNHETAPPSAESGEDIIGLIRAMLLAALIALGVRTFFYEPFNIPSSSMFPNLLVGDYLFVEKYAYGYSRYSFPFEIIPFSGRLFEKAPQRGDIAVFRQPQATHIDYIKRIIGLPGDTVQVLDGTLYINGTAVPRVFTGVEDRAEENVVHVYQKYRETLPEGRAYEVYELSDMEENDNTEIYTVPPGHYFAMGDNRDRSLDSRVLSQVGFVPAENLVGRAALIFYSTEGTAEACAQRGSLAALKTFVCQVVRWPGAVRTERLFKRLNSDVPS